MSEIADQSGQAGGRAAQGDTSRLPRRLWLFSFFACTLLTAATFAYLDVPVARLFSGFLSSKEALAAGFGSAVLLGIEAAVAFTLIILRITRGHLSPFREATVLACLTSICAYAINDGTLKFFFGVPDPSVVMLGTHHSIHFLKGSSTCSFPSGHMVLAGSFAGVFIRLYRSTILPLSILLLIAAVLLIVGEWHFVSDVIAGTFLGVSAGVLAGKVWLAHSKPDRPS